MADKLAKLNAIISSSNFGHKIPGVSSNSSSFPILIQFRFLVTPGLFPTLVAFLPTRRLTKVDLPTLGIPTIKDLIFRFFSPLAIRFSFNSRIISMVLYNNDLTLPCSKSKVTI